MEGVLASREQCERTVTLKALAPLGRASKGDGRLAQPDCAALDPGFALRGSALSAEHLRVTANAAPSGVTITRPHEPRRIA